MTKICLQTNVPEVDNTSIGCDKLTPTDCIIHENAISYLGLPANSTTTEVIQALLLSLIDVRSRVLTLETP